MTPISPEFVRASRFLNERLGNLLHDPRVYNFEELSSNDLRRVAGSLFCRNIPSPPCWRWNQAKGRQDAFLSAFKLNVTISKLILRRKHPKDPPPPLGKLWLFKITASIGASPSTHELMTNPMYVVWLEIGSSDLFRTSTSTSYSPLSHEAAVLPSFPPLEATNEWIPSDTNVPHPLSNWTSPSSSSPNHGNFGHQDDEPRIEDYDFLARFMDNKALAHELWPHVNWIQDS